MDFLRQDLRHALRRLAQTPGFSAVAILSLALGIGANTAIFSVVDAVLLRRLPVASPDRLVEIYTSDSDGLLHATSSYPDHLDLKRATADVFEDVVAYEAGFAQVEGAHGEALAMGEFVTGNYFRTLGVTPALGRTFVPEEDATPGTHPVIVLGHGFWTRAFGADPAVVGQTIRVNRRALTVIGVAPPGFAGMFRGLDAAYYVPMALVNELKPSGADRLNARGSRSLFMKARLRPGVTAEAAAAAVTLAADALARTWPETNEGRRMTVVPTGDVSIHPVVDRALVPVAALLLAVVGLVLLIACANLAGFLLARAADRQREIAVRLALGAGRARLVRQLLVECIVLALFGGAGGLLVAYLTIGAIVAFQPPLPIPIQLDLGLDGRMLAFTFLVSVAAGVAFGLAPGLHATRPDVAGMLRAGAAGLTAGRSRSRLRGVLVAGQVAVSLVLLVGSGLFLRSLREAQHIDPGFDTGPAAILWPNMELSGISGERVPLLQQQLKERLRTIPGVTGVALADRIPLGANVQTRPLNVDGISPPAGQDALHVDFAHVDADYFEVMDVPIVRGRPFLEAEGADTPPVVIVSEAAAARFWPDGDAVGRTIWLGTGRDTPARVVGVARDSRVRSLGEATRPYVYMNARQETLGSLLFVVRGPADDARLLAAARRLALEEEPGLVLMEAKTMDEHLALLLFAPRMAAALLSIAGGLALGLAAIGLYGLVSYAVARRTREVGIRMALGASARDVVRLMTGHGVRLVAIGAGVGVLLAALAAWPLAGFLYGIDPLDVATFVAVAALLALVGVLAAWVPARRASRVQPAAALRAD